MHGGQDPQRCFPHLTSLPAAAQGCWHSILAPAPAPSAALLCPGWSQAPGEEGFWVWLHGPKGSTRAGPSPHALGISLNKPEGTSSACCFLILLVTTDPGMLQQVKFSKLTAPGDLAKGRLHEHPASVSWVTAHESLHYSKQNSGTE